MAHRKQGYRFENDWPLEDLEYISQNYKAGTTIPVNVKIEAEHHVLKRFGLFPHLLTSHAISVTDASACTDCGGCVERCQFGAREMVDGSLSFNQDLCFGCGLCVTTCPTNAITLIDKQ